MGSFGGATPAEEGSLSVGGRQSWSDRLALVPRRQELQYNDAGQPVEPEPGAGTHFAQTVGSLLAALGPGRSAWAQALKQFVTGEAATMAGQLGEGREVNPIKAATEGGLASPLGMAATTLGIHGVAAAGSKIGSAAGKGTVKHGMGPTGEVGIEERVRDPRLMVPSEGRDWAPIRPNATREYVDAAKAQSQVLGRLRLQLAEEFMQENPKWRFDGKAFADKIDERINAQQYNLTSDAERQALEAARKTLLGKLGAFVEEGALPGRGPIPGIPSARFWGQLKLTDVVRIKTEAGNEATRLLGIRTADLKPGQRPPAATAAEVAAREVWQVADDAIRNSGGRIVNNPSGGGTTTIGEMISDLGRTERELIAMRQQMAAAAERGTSGFWSATGANRPQTTIPLGTWMQGAPEYNPSARALQFSPAVLNALGGLLPYLIGQRATQKITGQQ